MASFTYRIIIFLLSIFEGSSDENVIKQVENFVNPVILLRRLEFIYMNIVKPRSREI